MSNACDAAGEHDTFGEDPVQDIESQENNLLYFWDNEIKQQYDEIFITGGRGGTE